MIRCGGNVWNTGSEAVAEPEKHETQEEGGDQYTRLRNEWSQEAEELFSDISQQLCLANYGDSQPAKVCNAFYLLAVLYWSSLRVRLYIAEKNEQTALEGLCFLFTTTVSKL